MGHVVKQMLDKSDWAIWSMTHNPLHPRGAQSELSVFGLSLFIWLAVMPQSCSSGACVCCVTRTVFILVYAGKLQRLWAVPCVTMPWTDSKPCDSASDRLPVAQNGGVHNRSLVMVSAVTQPWVIAVNPNEPQKLTLIYCTHCILGSMSADIPHLLFKVCFPPPDFLYCLFVTLLSGKINKRGVSEVSCFY